MIHTLHLTYNVAEAVEYYNILQEKFGRFRWHYTNDHCNPQEIGDKNRMNNVYGWGLQTVYSDPNFPYHCDIDPHDEGPEYFKDTELVFGFFKNIRDKFINPYRSFLMTFPPDHGISKWMPEEGIPHGKVFIPIVTNDKTKLVDLTANQEVTFELGKVYMFDMTKHFGEFKNDGDTEITFITFNVPVNTFNHVLSIR